jgi:hypothetical protein
VDDADAVAALDDIGLDGDAMFVRGNSQRGKNRDVVLKFVDDEEK